MSVGFIKIHRSIFDNWVADEPEALAVWVRILSEANFKATKKKFNGSLIEVQRGQLIFGLNAFSDRSGVSVMKLRRIISELESDGMINRQKTNRYSLITVVSYDSYQDVTIQQQAINNPLTDKQHADNTRITTLEEVKKETSEENNPSSTKADKIPYLRIKDLWNEHCPNLKGVRDLTPKRKTAIKKLWNQKNDAGEYPYRDSAFYIRWFTFCNDDPWYNGTDTNSTGWTADLIFCLKVDNILGKQE